MTGTIVWPGRRRAILAVLTLALVLSYADRYLMAVLVQPIRGELGLSDGQIGVLTGISFSLFYAAFALPVARVADRSRQSEVVAISVLVWSAMTAITGFAANFVQLALARFAVGAGEAGVFPTAQAIIAEAYPPQTRTGAMAIFASGGSFGLTLAFVLGSWLESRFGWRGAFVAMAVPGLVIAPAAWLILRPMRRRTAPRQHARTSLGQLLRNPHFRVLPFAQSAVVVLMFGQLQWLPAFFERSYGTDRATLGAILGTSQGFATISGTILGGVLSDRFRGSDPTWPLRMSRTCLLLSVPISSLLYLAAGETVAFVLAGLGGFLVAMSTGPIAAHIQFVVDADQRAMAPALSMMVAAILGLGLGPVTIGLGSDGFEAASFPEPLRASLLCVVIAATAWATGSLNAILRLQRV